MGLKKVLKGGLFSGLNPKKWVGYSRLKEDSVSVGKIAKTVLGKKEEKTPIKETFEEAVKRFGLSEKDIKKRIKTSKQLVTAFLVMGGLVVFLFYLSMCNGPRSPCFHLFGLKFADFYLRF